MFRSIGAESTSSERGMWETHRRWSRRDVGGRGKACWLTLFVCRNGGKMDGCWAPPGWWEGLGSVLGEQDLSSFARAKQ